MSPISRRNMVLGTASLAAGLWSGQAISQPISASSAIRFASIGVGGRGDSVTKEAAKLGEIAAICDVDEAFLQKAADLYPRARQYRDFRELLSVESDRIDAVLVNTPDHTHATIAIAAMNRGKHCVCEKPLARTPYEARRMADTARQKGVITQVGNQGLADNPVRGMIELARSTFGDSVREVHVWTDRPIWPQGHEPTPEIPPASLNYDLWLGPIEARPYRGVHPFKWRGFWDFGCGAMDTAPHLLNVVYAAFDLHHPVRIRTKSSGHNNVTFPKQSIIHFDFPETQKRPAVTLSWYDGGNLPASPASTKARNGVSIVGGPGMWHSFDSYNAVWQDSNGRAIEAVPHLLPETSSYLEEFVASIRSGNPPLGNFPDFASPQAEMFLAGNVALKARRDIDWDPKSLQATNAPELDSFIRPKYRTGFEM